MLSVLPSTYRSWVFTFAFSPWASSAVRVCRKIRVSLVPPSFLPTTSASLWMPGSRPIYSGIRTISRMNLYEERCWPSMPLAVIAECVVGDGGSTILPVLLPAAWLLCGSCQISDAGKDEEALNPIILPERSGPVEMTGLFLVQYAKDTPIFSVNLRTMNGNLC